MLYNIFTTTLEQGIVVVSKVVVLISPPFNPCSYFHSQGSFSNKIRHHLFLFSYYSFLTFIVPVIKWNGLGTRISSGFPLFNPIPLIVPIMSAKTKERLGQG